MPVFRETFNRRYKRLKQLLEDSGDICFVCNNRHKPIPDFAVEGKIQANKADEIVDYVNFLQKLNKIYPHRKWTLLHVEHSDSEHEILKYNACKNITIYNVKTYDIHESNTYKDKDYWKGNTKTWSEICSHLSLSHKEKRKYNMTEGLK